MMQFSVEQYAIGTLILFSIVTWALAFIKMGVLLKAQRQNQAVIDAWSKDSKAEAHRDGNSACAHLLAAAQDVVEQSGEQDAGRERLERVLHQQVRIERRGLERWLPILGSIASTSPFIGLFGTVWGIMSALKGIGIAGTASLDTVAGPVGSALIATGIGIAVAVPAVLFYNGLLRLVRAEVHRWEDFAFLLFDQAQRNDINSSAARR